MERFIKYKNIVRKKNYKKAKNVFQSNCLFHPLMQFSLSFFEKKTKMSKTGLNLFFYVMKEGFLIFFRGDWKKKDKDYLKHRITERTDQRRVEDKRMN